ncbi:hypothetical protein M9Y10_023435 [Tritrichomonas musculus]|uniref:Oxidation resistance protein 1 n=1 Tax=Tritrichomonas musculus TaxID=1915356 RepID=A0ABR2KVV7_9EUKA
MSATITVSNGDTLSKLSLMYSVSPSRLREINDLGAHDVRPGDVLKIESPVEYLASHHQIVVMLISSLDFFRENHQFNHDNDGSIPNCNGNILTEFSLLRSAISGNVVLTEDMIIFNQILTGNRLNKERYTFYINLVAISNTKLVPFYKKKYKSQNDKKIEKKDNDEKTSNNKSNQDKGEGKQKSSFSFFRRLFGSKSGQKSQDESSITTHDTEGHSDRLDDENIDDNETTKNTFRNAENLNINYGGVEKFMSLYEDEPSVLEICLFDDPLNKSQGLKSMSFFASRAELSSLEFLINFFSRQRRLEIGLKLVSPNDMPTLPQDDAQEAANIKAFHSSSLPNPQATHQTALKKSSLVIIIHDEQENSPSYQANKDDDSMNSKIFIDGNDSFGYAIQKSILVISENKKLAKKITKVDSSRKVGSLNPEELSPILSPKIITKSTLNSMSPISCHNLQLSNSSLTQSASVFYSDSFSYSDYPSSLTDATSLILDCINITMIRLNFPHRIMGLAWKLAFRLSRDGCSYQSLLEKTRDGHPCVLAILTNKNERIGAFLSDGIKEGKGKSSGGSSFVFSFSNPKRANINKNNQTENKLKHDGSNSSIKDDDCVNRNYNDDDDDDDDKDNDDIDDNKNENYDNDNDNSNANSNSNDDVNSDNDNNDNENDNDNFNSNNKLNNDSSKNDDSSSSSSSYFNRRNANVYRWSMLNDKFVFVSTTDLMIGSTSISDDKDKFEDRSLIFSKYRSDFAGRFGAAIWIDQKMNKGISENCPTFNSPPLVEGGTFAVNDIEVWNII